MAGKVVDVTLRLIDKLSHPLKGISGKLAESCKQWEKAGKQIQKVGNGISSVGSKMSKSLTVPIVGAGVACVKLANDFEAGMDKVQSIAGEVSNKELKSLQKEAKKMGLSFEEGASTSETAMNILSAQAKKMGAQTKFSATEATEAYSYMAMAGWKTEDMLKGIDGIMMLSGATGEDLASTSDIVTDSLTAFGMSADDTTRFVDVLASASSNANTNVTLLGESFKYVAPIAGSLNYSAEDTATALSMMANSGIKASQAGTSLRSWLTRMASPTKESATAMKALGLSLTDSNGKMKSLDTVMRETRIAFSKLDEAQKAQYASMLSGKTGMSGLLAIVNGSDDDFNKLTDAINNSTGACKEMYDVANDNLNGQLTILKSTLESIGISMGERLVPYVKKLTTFVQGLADKFNALTPAQQDMIIKIAGIIAVSGPAILMFGKMVTGIGKLVSAVGAVGKGIKTFGGILGMITSPAGIVVGVLALLALGAYLIYKNWDKLKPVIMRVVKAFMNMVDNLKPIMKTVVPQIMEIAQDAIKGLSDFVVELIPVIAPIFEEVFKTVSQVIKQAMPTIKTIAKVVGSVVQSVIKVVKQLLKAILPVIKQILNTVRKNMPIIRKTIMNVFKAIQPVIKMVMKLFQRLAKIISGVLSRAMKALQPVISKVGSLFEKIFPKVAKVVSGAVKVIGGIIKTLSPIFEKVFSVIGDVLGAFGDCVGGVFDSVGQILGGVIDFISGVFAGDWSKAWNGIVDIFKGIFNLIPTAIEFIINGAIGLINGLLDGINDITDVVGIPAIPHIPEVTIPRLAKGTDNWQGGIVQVSERGGEIIDLPAGSRVYPHDETVQKAYEDGARKAMGQGNGGGNVTITVPKLADQITVRSDADIDKIVKQLAEQLEKVALNMGGGKLGYLY